MNPVEGTGSGRDRATWLGAALLVAATLAAYAPALQNDFVNWDDGQYVTENPFARELSPEGMKWAFTTFTENNWHPLTWISHQLDGSLYGLEPAGHHATSVIFHAANAVLLFFVLRRLSGAPAPSLLVAALFALHPLNVESVAWVSERKNVLSTLFWILTMGAYARYVVRPGPARYLMVVAALALGLMAKPMLVTLPFVLLLLDWWPLRRFSVRALLEKVPLIALAVVSSAVTLAAQRAARMSLESVSLDARLANAFISYFRYLAKAFWPSGLIPYYSLPGTVEMPPNTPFAALLALAGLCAITAILLLWMRGRAPHLLLGWLWFLGTLVPVIGIVQVGAQAMADRYMYVPLIGVFIGLAWSIPGARAWPPRRMPAVLALAGLIGLALLTARQSTIWRDSATLWKATIAVNPRCRLALHNYGVFLATTGREQEGIARLEEVLRIDPKYELSLIALGGAYTNAGRYQEGLALLQRAVELGSERADAYYSMGINLGAQGRYAEARAALQAALDRYPDYEDAAIQLRAVQRAEEGAADRASRYEEALRRDPHDEEALFGLGVTYMREGRTAEALGLFQRVIAENPNHAEAMVNRGALLAQGGRIDGAIASYRAAMRAAPQNLQAPNNLGLLHWRLGNLREAKAAFEAGLAIAPGHVTMSNALAWILATAPDAELRDGRRAVELAEAAAAATGRTDANVLDTLAAAFAEVGRFADARAAAGEALALARALDDKTLVSSIEAHLAAYETDKPFRHAGGPL